MQALPPPPKKTKNKKTKHLSVNDFWLVWAGWACKTAVSSLNVCPAHEPRILKTRRSRRRRPRVQSRQSPRPPPSCHAFLRIGFLTQCQRFLWFVWIRHECQRFLWFVWIRHECTMCFFTSLKMNIRSYFNKSKSKETIAHHKNTNAIEYRLTIHSGRAVIPRSIHHQTSTFARMAMP